MADKKNKIQKITKIKLNYIYPKKQIVTLKKKNYYLEFSIRKFFK